MGILIGFIVLSVTVTLGTAQFIYYGMGEQED